MDLKELYKDEDDDYDNFLDIDDYDVFIRKYSDENIAIYNKRLSPSPDFIPKNTKPYTPDNIFLRIHRLYLSTQALKYYTSYL